MIPLEERFSRTFPGESLSGMKSEWLEIQSAYSAKGRHYHNLEHLARMFSELDRYPNSVSDPQSLGLSIFYHDLIYNPLRKDNEAASARRAEEILSATSLATLIDTDRPSPSESFIKKIEAQILATKDHQIPIGSIDPDLPILLDIDLAILGSYNEEYAEYARNVRKEYGVYPSFLYYPARKKAMRAFLEREQIYHTEFFQDMYETKARENIEREIGGKSA